MGKYQLDTKGQASVDKYYEKNKPVRGDKKDQLKEIREKFLKNKKNASK